MSEEWGFILGVLGMTAGHCFCWWYFLWSVSLHMTDKQKKKWGFDGN
jgi:hypothetical protein